MHTAKENIKTWYLRNFTKKEIIQNNPAEVQQTIKFRCLLSILILIFFKQKNKEKYLFNKFTIRNNSVFDYPKQGQATQVLL